MMFKWKLVSHRQENGRKPKSGPNFDPFDPNFGPRKILFEFIFK